MRRTALAIAAVLAACMPNHASRLGPTPITPTLVVVRNADLGPGTASPDLVLLVRDVDQPDHAVQEAFVTLLTPAGDTKPDARTALSRVDGIATLALPDRESSILLVR